MRQLQAAVGLYQQIADRLLEERTGHAQPEPQDTFAGAVR